MAYTCVCQMHVSQGHGGRSASSNLSKLMKVTNTSLRKRLQQNQRQGSFAGYVASNLSIHWMYFDREMLSTVRRLLITWQKHNVT